MAQTTQNEVINNILDFMESEFNITVSDARVAGWVAEIEGGEGRDAAQIRLDIIEHVIGPDLIREYVARQFEDRGLDITSGDETEEERLDRIVQEITEGTRTFRSVGESLGPAPPPEDVSPAPEAEGAGEGIPGIMGGGQLTRIVREGQDDLWAITYIVQGIQHVYTFASVDAVIAALGPDVFTSGEWPVLVLDESDVDDGDTWKLGDAEAFVGQGGTYGAYFDDLMREAALEGGIRDPGLLGDFLSDPDIQRIIAQAEAGGWGEVRVQAEIRLTDYYLNVLYPGIEHIIAKGDLDPEEEYRRYIATVTPSLRTLDYEKDEDGTYRQTVGRMLARGILAEDFVRFAPVFIRAEQSPEFADILSQWTQRDLGVTLDFEDWFDVLEGNTSPEIALVVEQATLQFRQEQTAIEGVSAATIARLARLTELSEAQIAASFSSAEQAFLRIGDRGLARFGLTTEELVFSAFDLSAEVPPEVQVGLPGQARSPEEVRRLVQKTAVEIGLEDDVKANLFLGFTQRGTPFRPGLTALAPEGG